MPESATRPRGARRQRWTVSAATVEAVRAALAAGAETPAAIAAQTGKSARTVAYALAELRRRGIVAGPKHHPRIAVGPAPRPTVKTPKATSPQGRQGLVSARPATPTPPSVRPSQQENSVWDAAYPGQADEILAERQAALEPELVEEFIEPGPPPERGILERLLLAFAESVTAGLRAQ